jgi:polynucleotide 5'-kinase involved in rRNA processing
MAKVNKAHALTINKLMLPLIATVAHADTVCEDADIGYYTMLLSDLIHNAAALDVFNSSLCASTLHNSILMQDTSPREHFYTVLKYIEDNKLISAKQYACS